MRVIASQRLPRSHFCCEALRCLTRDFTLERRGKFNRGPPNLSGTLATGLFFSGSSKANERFKGPIGRHLMGHTNQAVSNKRFANKRFSQLNDERCWLVREHSPSKCCDLPVRKLLHFVGKSAKRALTDVPTSLVIQL